MPQPSVQRTALPRWAAVACAAALTAAAAPAQAASYSLGTVAGPNSFFFDDVAHTTAFEDVFTFSIAAGTSLVFSGFAETPMSNRFWIDDLDGTVEQGGSVIGEATGVTIPYPFPRREVTFAAQTLGAGDYAVRLFGTATAAFPGPISSYDSTFTFSLAAPVPEPGTLALTAIGLLAVGAVARKRAR